MASYALVVLLVFPNGTADIGAAPFATMAECKAKRAEVLKRVPKSGAASYAIECVPVLPAAGA